MTEERIFVEITTCRKCGEFSMREVHHWLLGHEPGYEYTCDKAERCIMPSDGVEPPPVWCPLRPSNIITKAESRSATFDIDVNGNLRVS